MAAHGFPQHAIQGIGCEHLCSLSVSWVCPQMSMPYVDGLLTVQMTCSFVATAIAGDGRWPPDVVGGVRLVLAICSLK
jgi:hypothetical protein